MGLAIPIETSARPVSYTHLAEPFTAVLASMECVNASNPEAIVTERGRESVISPSRKMCIRDRNNRMLHRYLSFLLYFPSFLHLRLPN